MNIYLRIATIKDAECIWDMQKRAFQDLLIKYQDFDTNPANEPLEKLVNRLSQKERSYYFIEMDGNVIGAISVTDWGKERNKRLSPMFILPQFQGYGFAQRAIQEVERIHGKSLWELDTILQEEKLRHLYEKMGYRQTGEVMPINDSMSLVYYEK